MSAVEIRMLVRLPLDQLAALRLEASAQGFEHLERLVQEHEPNGNTFDQPGEALFGAYLEAQLVGVCGLNVDPYARNPAVGRVRRLYVATEHRRQGIGRRLVEAVIERARSHFDRLRLRTPDEPAARFYEALGFHRVMRANKVTHALDLGEAES